MLKKIITLSLVVLLLGLTSQLAMAFELVEDDREPATFGIGYEGTFTNMGISVTYNITDRLAVQGVAGIPYSFSNGTRDENNSLPLSLRGKLFYRVLKNSENDAYIFGVVGSFQGDTGQVFGEGVGLGGEVTYYNIPNLVYFLEAGYSFVQLPHSGNLIFTYGLRLYF